MKSKLVFAVVLGTALVGCREHASDSSVKTLDELASGKQSASKVCSGEGPTLSADERSRIDTSLVEKDSPLADFERIVRAIPAETRQKFFGVDRARIKFLPSETTVEKACGAGAYSCIRSNASGESTMYLLGYPAYVRSWGLIMFAQYELSTAPRRLDGLKEAFSRDLGRPLAQIEQAVQAAERDSGEAGPDLDTLVYLHAYDSAHCNAETRASMTKSFKNTTAVFRSVDQSVAADKSLALTGLFSWLGRGVVGAYRAVLGNGSYMGCGGQWYCQQTQGGWQSSPLYGYGYYGLTKSE